MYESFRSHCLQDYPEYEIIFGVSDADDPALELVERLKSEFPQTSDSLDGLYEESWRQYQSSNLAQMLPEAKYELILVNDSDIRVQPDYLRRVYGAAG